MEVTRPACDVFDHNEYPRVAFDDVREVGITVKLKGLPDFVRTGVLCRKAQYRLLRGIARLLKPQGK